MKEVQTSALVPSQPGQHDRPLKSELIEDIENTDIESINHSHSAALINISDAQKVFRQSQLRIGNPGKNLGLMANCRSPEVKELNSGKYIKPLILNENQASRSPRDEFGKYVHQHSSRLYSHA